MNCKVCGKENPDNVDLCVSCGSTLPRSGAEPTFPDAREVEVQSYFRAAWREFVRSPLVLLLILCFSAGMLCGWFEEYAKLLEIEMALGSLSIWSISLLPYRKVILAVFHIIGMLPSTLMAVGLWMVFADARNKPDRPIRTGGLKLILVLQVILMVILGILFCILLTMAGRAFLAMLVVAVLVMAMYWLIIAVIMTARNTARDCMPDSSYAKALAVVEFIAGGLNVLNIISGQTEITFTGIFNCAIAFVVGAVLLKYRDLMEALLAKCVEMRRASEETPAQEQTTNNYVPAWKRVQMEQENSEQ